jgi:hypothetical protein
LLLIASGTAIALYAAVFAHYPFESAYLIPAVPFVFIVVSLVMPKGVTVALCALVIVSSFLFGVSRIGNPEGVEASPVHLRLTTAGEDMLVDVLQGPVLLDLQRRRKTQELLERLYLFADTTRQKTVVMVQWFFPQIEFEHGGLTRGGFVVFVGGLAEHDIEVYKRKGYEIRYLQRMDVTHFRSYGVDLVSSGAKELRLLPQKDLK